MGLCADQKDSNKTIDCKSKYREFFALSSAPVTAPLPGLDFRSQKVFGHMIINPLNLSLCCHRRVEICALYLQKKIVARNGITYLPYT